MTGPMLKQLCAYTGLGEADLLKIAANGPDRYKVYRIRKRSGGWREIAQPAKELKLVQRALMGILLDKLPIHNAATAYVRGKSIRENADAHKGGMPILKMDFRDFFPSILGSDWARYCRDNLDMNEDDIELTTKLLFRRPRKSWKLRLSIGAPSSPMLSNILMFWFDNEINKIAQSKEISYTRYADDLTFSGQRIGMLKDMEKYVKKALRENSSPKIYVNNEKTVYVTAASRRTVTGVVLANDGTIGIGRDRKRNLSASVHHALNGKLSEVELAQLCGHLAFAKSVDPEFLDFLIAKYGAEAIRKIQASVDNG